MEDIIKKYQKIIADILLQIENKELKPGDKISSVRSLSKAYECSVDTVQKALMELRYRNYLYAVPKSGYYVLKISELPKNRKNGLISDLGNSMPDYNIFPYDDFRFCLEQVIRQKNPRWFTYHINYKGDSRLLSALQNLLKDYHIYAKLDNIVITTGIQQAIYLLTVMDFPGGKSKIVIEQPTYHMVNELINELNIPYVTIKRTTEGLDFKELEEIFKSNKIKFFYTMPRFHNPLGSSYNIAEKKCLVKLAKKYGVYILEDDYLGDFDQNKNNTPIFYYDTGNYVIYLKSFSKIIFPGLRIGCTVLPDALIESFVKIKKLINFDTDMITQQALSVYITSGMFNKHRFIISSLYHRKAKLFHNFMKRYGIEMKNQTHDTKKVFFLKANTKLEELAFLLKQNGIKVDFLDTNYINSNHPAAIKIDVGNIIYEDIEDTLQKFFSLAKDYLIITNKS